MKQRFFHIDVVRAIGVLGIIATHVIWNTNRDPLHFFVWNYLHFFVVAFVLCSAYVIGARGLTPLKRMEDILLWYRKRFLRLLLPMYAYLAAHFSLWFLLPQWFTGGGILQKNLSYVFQSLTLVGGLDISWLPLLFVQLTVLLPLFLWLFQRSKWLWVYSGFVVATTTWFTLNPAAHAFYRWVMWIPWSGIFLVGLWFGNKEQSDTGIAASIRRYLMMVGVGLVVFAALLWSRGSQVVLTNHKYPPDWYYLSYAMMMSGLLLVVSRICSFLFAPFQRLFLYISAHSYVLFFVFFIVLDFSGQVAKQISLLGWSSIQYVFVTGVSLLVCVLLDQLERLRYTATR